MGRWKTVYSEDLDKNVVFAGVYVIFVLERVAYVGQSENVVRRLIAHGFKSSTESQNAFFQKYAVPLGIVIKTRKEKFVFERLAAEQRLIHFLRPILNNIGYIKPNSRSLDARVMKAALAFEFS